MVAQDPFALRDAGDAALEQGQLDLARQYYEAAIQARPQFAIAHYRRGEVLLKQKRALEAAASFWASHLFWGFNVVPLVMAARALQSANFSLEACVLFERVNPTDLDPLTSAYFADALHSLMRIREAAALIPRFEHLDSPFCQVVQAQIMLELNRPEAAQRLLEPLVEAVPTEIVFDKLIGVYLTLEDVSQLENCLSRAVLAFPTVAYYRCMKAALGILSGHVPHDLDAVRQLERADIIDTATYLAERAAGAIQTGNTYQTFGRLLPQVMADGLILEFGVRFGHSITCIAEHLPARRIYGFDSFEGLPEAWHDEPAGSYTTMGRLPPVPANAELVVGWFADTLPAFKATHPEPIAFMNIDCDIYSATKTIFEQLDAQIVPGTIIVFDEYIGNKTWREDEFKAFQEWVAARQVRYRYLTYSLYTKQVSVQILERAPVAPPTPLDIAQTLALAGAQLASGRLEPAMRALESVLDQVPDQLDALINLGELKRRAGDIDAAVRLLERAVALAPENLAALTNQGAALQQAGRLDAAAAAYRRVLELNPRQAEALNNLAVLTRRRGDWEAAVTLFEQALALQPDNLMVRGNLCYLLERTNRLARLRDCLPAAREAAAHEPSLALAWAKLLRRDGETDAACAMLLQAAPICAADPALDAERLALLGEARHGLGDRAAAFASFAASNALARQVFLAEGVRLDSYAALVERLIHQPAADWGGGETPAAIPGRNDPVFLVGFPRSGTTLLDSILRGHPSVAVVEERPMVDRVCDRLQRLPGGYPGALANLDDAGLEALRARYAEELGQHLDETARSRPVVIDKLPLNLIHAGLIQRLFPRARFILALRHPGDCVLSCFMHNFAPNAAMANFLTLEDSARFYDQVMRLWERYRTLWPLNVHPIRYEDLVADFAGTLRPLLDFLELPWDESVRRHADTARERGLIDTPSYHQVVRPIYRTAAGRWEQYREQLAPVLPVLQPWAERWGYGSGEPSLSISLTIGI
jgi:Flp pilus assembly protein TadD/predicted O-methyltransferase YrrM